MSPLAELIESEHPIVLALIEASGLVAEGGKFDNRPTWDNVGSKFDNRPTWDNVAAPWIKKK